MSEYRGCNKCKYDSKESNEFPCVECSHNRAVDYFEPKTNADRIRNFSDEDLAEFLSEVKYDGIYYAEGQDYPMKSEVWAEWLQAEVKEGE